MKSKLILVLLIILFILTACGNEPNITPNTEESKIIIDEERSLINFHVLLANDNRKRIGPLYAKFIIYDETLQDAIGADVIEFTDDHGNKQPFFIEGKKGYFISETFLYNAEIDREELINMVEVVISDENEMEIQQFLISTIEKYEAP
ncbi:hypothetical protein AWH56_015790 [Anaerobacillus isosaccharinicus]|uniref:Uncharacterized protein n=1 Tax=Anaerobacillus isosaccharinicus TaxID=1532552 RepID=A0A1S2L7M9_9BACI|nr:hypothetical protein [Anaerobacillus isosaccharinicus]MBA5587637.1 hypothetical protein [Anaerobacillus isosaccharinicus]QOY34189.1 hypothetical protein AWH56_015790 [Anaerobacillus isosaccharinicus]